jgi:hypothetical protein
MSTVSGSSAVRGLRGAMSWELFAALGEAPIPLTGLPEFSAGWGWLGFAPMRPPVRGAALLVAGVVAGASALALLSRSVERRLVRVSAEMLMRAFGTIEALLVDGIAATTLGVRGVSSDWPGFLANLRSATTLLRTSFGVKREVAGGWSDPFGSRPLGGGFDSLTGNVHGYTMSQTRRQLRQRNGATADTPASSLEYAMGHTSHCRGLGSKYGEVVNGLMRYPAEHKRSIRAAKSEGV